MMKVTLSYARYVFSVLVTIGFTLTTNECLRANMVEVNRGDTADQL